MKHFTLGKKKKKEKLIGSLPPCVIKSVLMKVWPVVSEILKVKHNNNDLEM